MKKILLILSIVLVSCSTTDEANECDCTKSTFERITYVFTGSNGLPQIGNRNELISTETVPCQPEQSTELPNNEFFIINCD